MIFASISLNHFKHKKFILFIFGLISLIAVIYLSDIIQLKSYNIRIVARDYRYEWLAINFFCVLFFYLFFGISKSFIKKICLFFYFYSLFAPIIFYLGLNYHYERINMMIAIPLILTIASYFQKQLFYIFLIIVMSSYLFLTIYSEMYTVGLT